MVVGVLASAPLALTVYVLLSLFGWFDSLFQPLVLQFSIFQRPIPGLGILVGLIFIFIVGVLAPSLLGKQFLILTERILEKVPLAKVLYSGTKQIFDSFTNDSFKKFNRVVFVPFPHSQAFALGFVTTEYEKSPVPGESTKLAVFVPTTPNPTGGYLLFIDEAEVRPASLTVEEALKVILSGGVVRLDKYMQS